ncbi:MAG: hypothetical protein A4E29_01183 [Methanomassiliicoccales archaeon PtaB.Bin134]|nr:MAG: hypothetical protein A4E29_01183 [Methanomassiliicoccales archaeon PtaB.Bin134]
MEVGKLLSKCWFIALVSLAVGVPSTFVGLSLVWRSVTPSMLLEGPLTIQLIFWIGLFTSCGGYIVSITCLLLAFGPRHVVEKGHFLAPEELVRAGYEVTRRNGSFDVRVAKYSVLRVYEGESTFRCLPTSTALWTIVILFLTFQLAALAFPIALYVHHRCWKRLDDITAEVSGDITPIEREVEDMVRDSLMGAYLLAREAADFRWSEFHDHVLILVVLALVSWTVLLVLSASDMFADRSLLGFALGTLVIAAVTLTGAFVLRERSRMDVEREERWAERLLSALRGEDGVGSPIELLLCACHQVPRWLSAHRKAMWLREPGKTLLIFILFNLGVSSFLQYDSIWWGFYLFGLVCLISGLFLLSSMIISARFESREMAREWERRIGEMDSLLEPGRGR